MKSKHKFTPDQVVPMEERALLSSFPAALGPVTKLHFRGAFVLTSRTYNNLQSQINTAIVNFEKGVLNAFTKDGGFTAAFDSAVGIATLGNGPPPLSYATGSLLAKLDAAMGSLEFKVPGGGANTASIGERGGVGLSNRTNLTTANPGEPTGPSGLTGSVAELMDETISADEAAGATSATLKSDMDLVRGEALGIVPAYIKAFGPQGAKEFGLANS